MNDRRAPALTKWPFYLADLVLLLLALWLLNHYPHPLPLWPAILMVGCVAGAAFVGVLPFRLEYETAVKFAEAGELTQTVKEIENLKSVAEQIRSATGQWQTVQEHSTRSVNAAKEISDQMAAEAKAFAEFMRKANDSEKATLRLEAEKLRRGEGQWLQLIVHLLDHTFALHQAGARSGQPNLEAQLRNFQEACRDVVRRVGLTPFEGAPNEVFDPEKHQLVDGESQPPSDSRIGQTLATGYTFQGQLLRRSVVTLQPAEFETGDLGAKSRTAQLDPATAFTDSAAEELAPEIASAENSLSPGQLAADQEFRLLGDDLENGDKQVRPTPA